MKRNLNIGGNCPNGAASCVKELAHFCPVGGSAELSIGFISNLYHSHIYARITKLIQAICSVALNCFGSLINTHIAPCLWRLLLGWVCPEIRVMEINQYLHTGICGILSDFNGLIQIVVSTAVTISIRIIWIVPYTDSNIIYATFSHQIKEALIIQLISIKIIEFNAAVP